MSAEKRHTFIRLIVTALALFGLFFSSSKTWAKEKTEQLTGQFYSFDAKSNYDISKSKPSTDVLPIGQLNVCGEFQSIGNENLLKYDVSKDSLKIMYAFDTSILDLPKEQWHITEDDDKRIDEIKLENKIKNGAIIIQTSLDGNKWVTDTEQTNVFTSKYDNSKEIYTTKDIQLVNGCYYRIIISYKQERVTGSSKVVVVEKEDKEYRQISEVYEFYAENSSEKELSNPSSTPRKELGEKIAVKKDSGYSEEIKLDSKNPHYGWDLGIFSINGYTRETTSEGKPLFLKNAGDKVTLWFHLDKDIEDLDGNGKYVIAEDKNGYDQYFQTKKTNFKHGALIIKYKDNQKKYGPYIYTDFLAASATTGADTRAVLFEEGDYEVALDYSIGKKGVLKSENDYRIFFEFSIRNGNTMFFPFDISTGAELRDHAVTPSGFTIDMAKSRYLDINVKRTAIVETATGHSEDVRFNGPAKDGAKYTEEGVYTVSVVNRYTNENTVKTFFVGKDPFIIALAKSGKSVKELDDLLSKGYVINGDGSVETPKNRR